MQSDDCIWSFGHMLISGDVWLAQCAYRESAQCANHNKNLEVRNECHSYCVDRDAAEHGGATGGSSNGSHLRLQAQEALRVRRGRYDEVGRPVRGHVHMAVRDRCRRHCRVFLRLLLLRTISPCVSLGDHGPAYSPVLWYGQILDNFPLFSSIFAHSPLFPWQKGSKGLNLKMKHSLSGLFR